MVANDRKSWESFLEYFQVPGESIYLLGCFAHHVTLYSQQVRAFNLIAGLFETGRLKKGCSVVVIGSGAAGLSSAAGAAHLGAKVTLLDRLSGPMGLQRNNRQRYLHPYIYDWPNPEHKKSTAEIPFLSWNAGYAADVIAQIEERWKNLAKSSRSRIDEYWSARDVSVFECGKRVTWNNGAPHTAKTSTTCDLVIMAVGYGLEAGSRPWEWSYWSDDGLDGDFRKWNDERRILVIGAGDGGLVDAMRVCLTDFRHDKVVDSITRITGLEELGLELLSNDQAPNRTELEISRGFEAQMLLDSRRGAARLGTKKVLTDLMERLEPHVRENRKVSLAAQETYLYGPRSSLLNRLIVSQLCQLGCLRFMPHRVERIKLDPKFEKYHVEFSGAEAEVFDEVISRVGPEPSWRRVKTEESLKRRSGALARFPEILKKCTEMPGRWDALLTNDYTRQRQWRLGLFGNEEPAK